LDISAIADKIEGYKARGLSLFATSSFQTQSLPLLHILSRIDASIPVYFINTGFLFPASLRFRDRLAKQLGLRVVTVHPAVPKSQQIGCDGQLLFANDPDRCCYLNKVQPMETVIAAHDVWINGVRADQTAQRKAMQSEQPGPHGVLRYHPMLAWSARDVHAYMQEHGLPPHPLEAEGYLSIGCEPCTRKYLEADDGRGGRWFGMNKRECGLHTELASTGDKKQRAQA